MTEIQIEYCVASGFLPRAEEVQHALLTELGRRVDGVRLKPGRGGVFQVSAGGELIFDKTRDDFDVAEIVRRAAEPATGRELSMAGGPGASGSRCTGARHAPRAAPQARTRSEAR